MTYIILKENDNKSLFEKIFEKFYKLKIENNGENKIIYLDNLNKITLNKLNKYFKIDCTSIVCISNDLMQNKMFLEILKNENINFFDGRKIFEILTIDIVNYIVLNKKDKIEYQEISILTNTINENVSFIIKELAIKIKTLNIISKNLKQFENIEKKLFNDSGIILNLTNNYNNSLKRNDIIINYDFSEEEINKFSINKNACIINLANSKISNFEGINICSAKIKVPNKYGLNTIKEYFNEFILYESIILKNTSIANMQKKIKNDSIHIECLIGQKDIIRKNEFVKISKKISI